MIFECEDESEDLQVTIKALNPSTARVREMDIKAYNPARDGDTLKREAPPASRSITLKLGDYLGDAKSQRRAQFRVVDAGTGAKLRLTVSTWPSKTNLAKRTIPITVIS